MLNYYCLLVALLNATEQGMTFGALLNAIPQKQNYDRREKSSY